MRYDAVARHRGRWPARLMCRVPGASPGGYDDWRGRPARRTAQGREALVVAIEAVHGGAKARYGGPRIRAELVARGQRCRADTVAKLMRPRGIAVKTERESRCTSDANHDRPAAGDVLDRRSEPGAADRTWAADITYIPTRRGWLYLAAVEDLHARRIVGRSMSERIDSRLVVDALGMAISRRLPAEGLVAHSDRGGQYASEHYQRLPAGHGITCGVSRRASCRDNAPVESFFAGLKKGLVHDADFATRAEARAELLEYIEACYGRVRRHSSLGYRSPDEYERAG